MKRKRVFSLLVVSWQKCKTDPLTFTFFHFSPLTLNICQCKIPLNPSYGLPLMSLKRHHFPFLFLFFFFKISELKEKNCSKKKTFKGNNTRKRVGKTIARSHSISRLFSYKRKFKSNLVLSLVDD